MRIQRHYRRWWRRARREAWRQRPRSLQVRAKVCCWSRNDMRSSSSSLAICSACKSEYATHGSIALTSDWAVLLTGVGPGKAERHRSIAMRLNHACGVRQQRRQRRTRRRRRAAARRRTWRPRRCSTRRDTCCTACCTRTASATCCASTGARAAAPRSAARRAAPSACVGVSGCLQPLCISRLSPSGACHDRMPCFGTMRASHSAPAVCH